MPNEFDFEKIKFERERLEFEQKKLQNITAIVAIVGVIISSAQSWVAYKQSNLTAAQTIEKFIPHLQKDDTKDTAILIMQNFCDNSFLTRLASSIKATGALQTMSVQGSASEKSMAVKQLTELDKQRSQLIEQMFGEDKKSRISATTELQIRWKSDIHVVPQAVDRALRVLKSSEADYTSNMSGVINTLILIRDFPLEMLRANEGSIDQLLQEIYKKGGAQSNRLARQIQDRLKTGLTS